MTRSTEDEQELRAPLEREAQRFVEPFRGFVDAQSASGWILLSATMVAIVAANSPWRSLYFDLVHFNIGLQFGNRAFEGSLRHWVNDGLMAIFFFLLGLELKREILVGQLRSKRHALSVVCAALGGIVMPAIVFIAVTAGTPARPGWGVTVATDTAFALTVLAALGDRVPASARAFLVGLAIVDDLAAIALIMVAYTTELDASWLLPTGLCVGVLCVLNLTGVRRSVPYWLAGVVLWALFLRLGVHGTLAGVIVALAAPVRPAMTRTAFLSAAISRLRRFQSAHDRRTETILEQPEQQDLAIEVGRATRAATVPLRRWEDSLQSPVSLAIVPLFAFLNAGVPLTGSAEWVDPLAVGVATGLLVGKPLGITVGVFLGRCLGIAELPAELTWRHLSGIGLLGGIGFTMSLFIAMLSFGESGALIDSAKRSVIAASAIAGLSGYIWLSIVGQRDKTLSR